MHDYICLLISQNFRLVMKKLGKEKEKINFKIDPYLLFSFEIVN